MTVPLRGTPFTIGITLDAFGNGSIAIPATTMPLASGDVILVGISHASATTDLVGPTLTGDVSGVLTKDADLYSNGTKDINAWLYSKKITGVDTTLAIAGGAPLANKTIQTLVRAYSGGHATYNDVPIETDVGTGTDLADPPPITPITNASKIVAWHFGAQTANVAFGIPSGMSNFLQGSISVSAGRVASADISWSFGNGTIDPPAVTGGNVNAGNSWAAGTYVIRDAAGISVPPYVVGKDVNTFIPAADVRNSIAVCAHPNFYGGAWELNRSYWQNAVIELDAPYMRTRVGTLTTTADAIAPITAAGIKLIAIYFDGKSTPDTVALQSELNFIRDNIGASNVAYLEGPNEYNGATTDWVAVLQAFISNAKTMIRAMPAYNGVPIIGPSMSTIVTDPTYNDLGNIETYFDYATGHYYPVGMWPMSSMSIMITSLRTMAPSKPKMFTETGWRTSWVPGEFPTNPREPLGKFVISERAAAKYFNRAVFDYLREGVKLTCVYSIMDDVSGFNATSKHFGLITSPADGSRKKQQFHALRRLIALYKDTGGAPPAGELGYTLAGSNTLTRQHVAKRSDGKFLLSLFQDVPSWNRVDPFGDIEPAPLPVTVNLTAPKKVEEIDPTFNEATITVNSTSAYTVQVKDYPTILRISPAVADDPPIVPPAVRKSRKMFITH